MKQEFIRTAALYGEENMQRLSCARIALFGVGGVGSYALEALVRSGIGNIDIFDNDTVSVSNINRQIIALQNTVGQPKTEVAASRARQINPDVNIRCFNMFFLRENADTVDFSAYDYVIDAVDTVAAKIEIIERATKHGVPVISVMGTGNKVNPTLLRVDDIYKTSICPLARVMRTELKKHGIKELKTVWSPEKPLTPNSLAEKRENGRVAPASTAFVPAAAGLIAAAEVVNHLTR